MLDTNICIYVIRNRPDAVIRRFRRKRVSEIGISSITLSELEYGAAKSLKPEQNKLALTEFLTPIEILPYDDMAAHRYGAPRPTGESRSSNRCSGHADRCTCSRLGCILVTNNESEFGRVPGLRVENWTA